MFWIFQFWKYHQQLIKQCAKINYHLIARYWITTVSRTASMFNRWSGSKFTLNNEWSHTMRHYRHWECVSFLFTSFVSQIFAASNQPSSCVCEKLWNDEINISQAKNGTIRNSWVCKILLPLIQCIVFNAARYASSPSVHSLALITWKKQREYRSTSDNNLLSRVGVPEGDDENAKWFRSKVWECLSINFWCDSMEEISWFSFCMLSCHHQLTAISSTKFPSAAHDPQLNMR